MGIDLLDEEALTFRASVPELCGDCHKKGGKAPQAAELRQGGHALVAEGGAVEAQVGELPLDT